MADLSPTRMGTRQRRCQQQSISQVSIRLLLDFARTGCCDWMGDAIRLSLFRIDALRRRHDGDLVGSDQPLGVGLDRTPAGFTALLTQSHVRIGFMESSVDNDCD